VSRALAAALTLLVALASLAPRALAHALLPAAVSLVEGLPAHYQVRFRRPARLARGLKLELPARCSLAQLSTSYREDQAIDSAQLSCPGGLEHQPIGVTGLGRVNLDAIVHIQHRSGESARALLSPGRESFLVPSRTSIGRVLLQYGQLGAEHLIEGLDHLLFTTGLLMLGARLRVLLLLSAFTLGHSVSLGLLALWDVSLPQGPVELAIALSLIGLALAVLGRARAQAAGERAVESRSSWGPAGMCGAVGLLHGLGFAQGLRQLALPSHAALPALLGFNLGIEAAQLGLVCLLAPCVWLVTRRGASFLLRARLGAGYATGSLAAMWCIERAVAWLG
jgi:hypothetical protein